VNTSGPSGAAEPSLPLSPAEAALLYGFLALAYFLSNFFRVSAAVVIPRAAAEIGLSAGWAGLLSSLFFCAYGAAQPACGSLNDRHGPLRVCAAGMLLTAAGSLCFLLPPSALSLGAGRALTGLGLAPIFSGLLVHQANAFRKELYAPLFGLSIALGNLGAVVSVGPLGWGLEAFGRAGIFGGLATVALLSAGTLWLRRERDPVRLRRDPAVAPRPVREALLGGFGAIRRSRPLAVAVLLWAVCVGALLCLQGLWGPAWFETAYGVSPSAARNWSTLIGVGMMAGTIAGGRVATLFPGDRRAFAVAGGSYVGAWFLQILSVLWLPLPAAGAAGLLLGIACGVCVVCANAAVSYLVPRERMGEVLGAANLLVFASVILFQQLTGLGLALFPGDRPGDTGEAGFAAVFAAVALTVGGSFLSLRRVRSFR